MAGRLSKLISFVWYNFGPAIVYQVVWHRIGLRAAIISSMAIALLEWLTLRRRGQKPSKLFVLSTAMCVVFGAIDLYLAGTYFMNYEAPLVNLFYAGAFAITLWDEVPILQRVAEEKSDMSRLDARDRRFFFQGFTIAWILFFMARSGTYLWINFHQTPGNAFLIRSIVGTGSMMLMIAASTLGGKPLWILCTRWKFLPSLRNH